MTKSHFTPWIGKQYGPNGVLIVSESVYDWKGDDGKIYTPKKSHALDGIPWHIARFGQNRYFTAMNRALSGEYHPTVERMEEVWSCYAYTIYVQSSVGFGPRRRPSKAQWAAATPHFQTLLEKIRPAKVIVTGIDMWNRMPDCALHLSDDIQAYQLADGHLVWCLALPHPGNSTKGFKWDLISERIRVFNATTFPTEMPA